MEKQKTIAHTGRAPMLKEFSNNELEHGNVGSSVPQMACLWMIPMVSRPTLERSFQMTNTTQTDLLDGVEPEAWMHDQRKDTVHNDGKALWLKIMGKQVEHYTKPLYSRETVEAMISQTLLKAADRCEQMALYTGVDCADELRRMALEPTGVDKGEKE
jgi:hypothetical protein